MCRLFGFRSVLQSQVHKSLVEADNSLKSLGVQNPDGWGVGYYVEGVPHVIKSPRSVLDDHIFTKISGVVRSQTVLAHIRKTTQGGTGIVNCHPFQYGRWIFAHNGNIKNFDKTRENILNQLPSSLRNFVLGETDSEAIFYWILHKVFTDPVTRPGEIKDRLEVALHEIIDIIGPLWADENGENKENYLSFMITDGKCMLAFHGGQEMHYSTYKSKCADAKFCEFYNPSCENRVEAGPINHLIVASEPLIGENQWVKCKIGDALWVDENMHFSKFSLDIPTEN